MFNELVGDVGATTPATLTRVPFTKIALRDANEVAKAVLGSVSVTLFSLLSLIVLLFVANAVVLW
jgi:small-conductance mechanosensitive channel